MQQDEVVRTLINRLLDYRIIHNVGNALTHKSQQGTYQAFAIDIGCYAHLRKLDGRFQEIDLSGSDLKEKARSAPIFNLDEFQAQLIKAPQDVEEALLAEPHE